VVQPPPGEEDHKQVHQRLAEGKFDYKLQLQTSLNRLLVEWLIRSLKVISLLSMQKKMVKDIFTLKKDGATCRVVAEGEA